MVNYKFSKKWEIKTILQGTAGNETINELLDRGNKELFDDLESFSEKKQYIKKFHYFPVWYS